jgi:hypothetical protein
VTALPAHVDDEARAQRVLGLARAHLRFGWIALLVFATLGVVLEALHAFKSGAYLGVGNEMRRLMWTLAHAHGIGLSLLHVGFAATLRIGFDAVSPRGTLASQLLRWATLLLPGGFFLGGVAPYEGDPGVGVWLAPVGAAVLWTAILLVALELVAAKR